MLELIRCFGPVRKGFCVDADFEIFPEDGDVFAKIEARAELGEGGVALLDVGDRGWGEEPRGERVFAHASAG